MVFLWLSVVLDPYLLARKEIAYRQSWLREWHAYERSNPRVRMSTYIREYKKDRPKQKARPVIMPYTQMRSYGKLLLLVATACFVLSLLLFLHAYTVWNRTDDRTAFTTLCWFTGITVVTLLVWVWLLWEEMLVPAYARSEPNHQSAVPPLEVTS
jgi:hypothetical protein